MNSPDDAPSVPKLQLGHFETGGGWGLGDQFARLPPASEQEKSRRNIYKVAPEGRVDDGAATMEGHRQNPTRDGADGGRVAGGAHCPTTSALRSVPETDYIAGGGEDDDDDTFVDHGSSAHPNAPPPIVAKTVALRTPVVKSGPPGVHLGSPLQPSTSTGFDANRALGTAVPTATSTGAEGCGPGHQISTAAAAAAENRLGVMRSVVSPTASHQTATAARLHGASAGKLVPSSVSAPAAAATKTPPALWDPPRVVSRMSLTQPVRDMAVDPCGDRLWMAVGDDPLVVLELRGTNLHTSKTLDHITQVYCMAVVEVPSGMQTTFKNVDVRRARKKRGVAGKTEADSSVVSSRYELWCGLSRGHIAVVDLDHATDGGIIAQAHNQPVNRIWSLSNGRVWTAGRDKAVRVWDPQARRKLKNRNIAAILSELVYVPHTKQVWASADDNVIRVYEGGGDNACLQRPGHDKNDNLIRMKSEINSLAYHADANIVWVCMGRSTALMDPRSYEVAVTLSASVSAVSFYQKTAVVAGQGAFFFTETCCLAVLDVTDPLSPSMLFRGSPVESVNRIGLRLFFPSPLAVIAHDEGKANNKKRRLSVFTYDHSPPMVPPPEPDDTSRPPQQRQEMVGYRSGASPSGAGTALAAGNVLLASKHMNASTPPPANPLTLGMPSPSTGFTAVTPTANGVSGGGVGPARHVNHITTNLLSMAAAGDAIAAQRSPGNAGNALELASSTAVVDPAAPTRAPPRDAEAVITPGPAAPPRSAEVAASLMRIEKRTEEAFGVLANVRRTEGPLADLAKLHSESSAWLLSSDVASSLPALPREETERVEREYWSPEGRVLALLMGRLRLAANANAAANTDPNKRSPTKQKSPQSPASSLSLAPTGGQSPPAVQLPSTGTGQSSHNYTGGGSLQLVPSDAKNATGTDTTPTGATTSGAAALAAPLTSGLQPRGDSPTLVTLATRAGADGTDAYSSEGVLQWVAQLSRSSQEERRLNQRQMQSLQRQNKRIAERNASLVNGMTKICESVRNWGLRVADEADAQWTRVSPQANPVEADHQRLFINITRRTLTELDDVLTTSGPRDIRNYVTRMQGCLSRVVALQDRMQQFFLASTTEMRLSAAASAPAVAGAGASGAQSRTGASSSTAPASSVDRRSASPPAFTAGVDGPPVVSARHGDQGEASVRGLDRTITPESFPSGGAHAADTSSTTAAKPASTPPLAPASASAPTTTATAGSAEAIIEAGLAPPLAVGQLVSFLDDQVALVKSRMQTLSSKWKRTADVHRVLYAPYYGAASGTTATATATAATGAHVPETVPRSVPELDLGTDFTTFPVLWDLEAAHAMYQLCVRESQMLIYDTLLAADSVVQRVPVRDSNGNDKDGGFGEEGHSGESVDGGAFQNALVGTPEYTRLLLEDIKENLNRTNGLTPSFQRRLVIAGLYQDHTSRESQRQSLEAVASLSRRVTEISEKTEETGKRIRDNLAQTLEKLTVAVEQIEMDGETEVIDGNGDREALPGSTDAQPPRQSGDPTSGSSTSSASPVSVSGMASAPQLSSAASRPSRALPLVIFGGFLGMEGKPLIFEGRLRGGVYWAHVYLSFLHECLNAVEDLLSPDKIAMPRTNFLAITEMIVSWRDELEKLGSTAVTVRSALAATEADIDDIVNALPTEVAEMGSPGVSSRPPRRFSTSSGLESAAGMSPSTAADARRDATSWSAPNALTSGMANLMNRTAVVDSWVRSLRSGSRRGLGDNTAAGGASAAGAGGAGSASSGAATAASSEGVSALSAIVHNSFELNLFALCLRLYLHEACTPPWAVLQSAQSMWDLEGSMRMPALLRPHMHGPAANGDSEDSERFNTSHPSRCSGAGDVAAGDLVDSPVTRNLNDADGQDGGGSAADNQGGAQRVRLGLQHIIASLDSIILKVQQMHMICRTLDARVTTIVEENANFAALSEEDGKARNSGPRRAGDPAHYDPYSSLNVTSNSNSHNSAVASSPLAPSEVVRLTTDPLLLSRLSGGSVATSFGNSYDGSGGALNGLHASDVTGVESGSYSERSPHRSGRHHRHKSASYAGTGEGGSGSLRRRHSDTPDAFFVDADIHKGGSGGDQAA